MPQTFDVGHLRARSKVFRSSAWERKIDSGFPIAHLCALSLRTRSRGLHSRPIRLRSGAGLSLGIQKKFRRWGLRASGGDASPSVRLFEGRAIDRKSDASEGVPTWRTLLHFGELFQLDAFEPPGGLSHPGLGLDLQNITLRHHQPSVPCFPSFSKVSKPAFHRSLAPWCNLRSRSGQVPRGGGRRDLLRIGCESRMLIDVVGGRPPFPFCSRDDVVS